MSDLRISEDNSELSTVLRGEALTIDVDGQSVEAHAGETVAAALLATGHRRFRHTEKETATRGIFCGMGICFIEPSLDWIQYYNKMIRKTF